MPAENVTLFAQWTKNSSDGSGDSHTYYDVKISKTGEETISPDGVSDSILRVKRGITQTFTFAPSEGYVIREIIVDDKSVGTETPFKNLKVIFEKSEGSNITLDKQNHFAYMSDYPILIHSLNLILKFRYLCLSQPCGKQFITRLVYLMVIPMAVSSLKTTLPVQKS